jgi:hypothetical protein
MPNFLMLMHNDAVMEIAAEMWPPYLSSLSGKGIFDGGSAIAVGEVFRKQEPPGKPSEHIGGYLRVRAESLADARELLAGNPVYECGGTVEMNCLAGSRLGDATRAKRSSLCRLF